MSFVKATERVFSDFSSALSKQINKFYPKSLDSLKDLHIQQFVNDVTNFAKAAKDFSANVDNLILNVGEIQQYQDSYTKAVTDVLNTQIEFKTKSRELRNYKENLKQLQATQKELKYIAKHETDLQSKIFRDLDRGESAIWKAQSDILELEAQMEKLQKKHQNMIEVDIPYIEEEYNILF